MDIRNQITDPHDDEELKRLIWEEWEGEIKEEDPRQMVFKYMKLMREACSVSLNREDLIQIIESRITTEHMKYNINTH